MTPTQKRERPRRSRPPKGSKTNPIPDLKEIAGDLLQISPIRTLIILLSPLVVLSLYFLFAHLRWWPLALVAMAAFHFFSYASTCHELVHGNLLLPNWFNRLALSFLEILALRSGTAYRISHLYHHLYFPDPYDVEGAPARGNFWQALLAGPLYQIRIWLFAWTHAERERATLLAEAAIVVLLWMLGIIGLHRFPDLLVYEILVTTSSWLFPLFLVYFQHNAHGANPLTQTRLFRSRWISILTFHHLYHLEHHLYPQVPHPFWQELARRLDPYFTQAGLKPIRLI